LLRRRIRRCSACVSDRANAFCGVCHRHSSDARGSPRRSLLRSRILGVWCGLPLYVVVPSVEDTADDASGQT
jgi:hypothetical protein